MLKFFSKFKPNSENLLSYKNFYVIGVTFKFLLTQSFLITWRNKQCWYPIGHAKESKNHPFVWWETDLQPKHTHFFLLGVANDWNNEINIQLGETLSLKEASTQNLRGNCKNSSLLWWWYDRCIRLEQTFGSFMATTTSHFFEEQFRWFVLFWVWLDLANKVPLLSFLTIL